MKFASLYILIFFAAFVFSQCGSEENSPDCPTATCNDYLTQAQAQAAFDADKKCRNDLDEDDDGIACEHLSSGGGGGFGCPTSGNCGCSNKKKAECVGDCCKWVVGTGCKCR